MQPPQNLKSECHTPADFLTVMLGVPEGAAGFSRSKLSHIVYHSLADAHLAFALGDERSREERLREIVGNAFDHTEHKTRSLTASLEHAPKTPAETRQAGERREAIIDHLVPLLSKLHAHFTQPERQMDDEPEAHAEHVRKELDHMKHAVKILGRRERVVVNGSLYEAGMPNYAEMVLAASARGRH